ncbi:MAG: divalent metal cation transporter [Patescibacteria group bacterium]|jgi:NRAMP (natural resistance-associated macrophage protein)-like metal ion transporter
MRKKDLIEKIAEAPAVALEYGIEEAEKFEKELISKKPVMAAEAYWKNLGPGLTTGAADDDPSGIATYSQAGAKFGYQLLWLAPITFPLMAVIQEMCSRVSMITGRGLAKNIKLHYPAWALYSATAMLFFANSLNIGANLGIMAKATQLIFPGIGFIFLLIAFSLISVLLQIFTAYERYARFLKYLALVLFFYAFSALSMNLDWRAVLKNVITPSITFSREQAYIICAIFGTTISPYLFFWQSSQEVEEEILAGRVTVRERQKNNTDADIKKMRIDVWSGMLISNVAMFFIIIACAGALFKNGITDIESAEQAALALRPFAGELAFFFFSAGIIGTGLLSIPVLAGSASYALSEAFGWKNGLYRKLKDAKAFYGIIITSMALGLIVNSLGIDPIKTLIFSAVLNGLIAPVILFLIVNIASDKKIMGRFANSKLSTLIGWLTILIMSLAGIAVIAGFFI